MTFIRKTFFYFSLLLMCPAASALSIVAKEDAPYIGNTLPGQGISVDIVTTALQRAGYKTTFSFQTWPRAYEGAQIGVYDVIGSIWQTAARDKDFAFSDAYLQHQIQFIKRKSNASIHFTKMNDLNGLIIGTIKGYAYGDAFTQSRKFIRVPQNHLLQNLLLLTQDQIDLTLGDVRKIRYELHQYMKGSIKDLEILKTPLIRRGAHIAVSRENPRHEEIIKRFNQALKDMQADGSYQRIIKKHDTLQ